MPSRVVEFRAGANRYLLASANHVAPTLRASSIRNAGGLIAACLSDPIALRALRGLVMADQLLADGSQISDQEVIRRVQEWVQGNLPRYQVFSTADTVLAGPSVRHDAVPDQVRPDLAITEEERALLREEDLRGFWRSRLDKLDPIARIGFGLWSHSAEEFRAAIETGNPDYWDHKGFAYWESMVRSTVVNLSVGLNRAGFRGNMRQEREMIRQAGVAVALLHADFVGEDHREGYGDVRGLLSVQQIADYHHMAFKRFGIEPQFYGGTWLKSVPDSVEYRVYGHLYCHDCDTNEGYPGPGGR